MGAREEQMEAEANARIAELTGQQPDGEYASGDPLTVEPGDEPVQSEPLAADDVRDLTEPPNPYAEAQPVKEPQVEDYEHKYKVLQGMYRKEVADVRAEIQRVNSVATQQATLIQELRRQVDEARAVQQSTPQASAQVLDMAEYEEFGPEIKKLAELAGQLQQKNIELERKLFQVNETLPQLQGKVRQVTEVEFDSRMDQMVPNWRDQDRDQNFINWLGNISPVTGRQIRESLSEAYQARDAGRVAGIFNEYRNFLALQNLRSAPPAAAAPAAPQQRRMPTPAPASRGGVPVPGASKKYTAQDFVTLQNEAQRGLWNDRPDEFRRLEAEMHASLTGRV